MSFGRPEAAMWDNVRPYLVPHGVWERVENGVLAGMADVSFCAFGSAGWIELKAPGRFPMRLKGWRKEQIAWTVKRCWHGDRCFGLIKTPNGLIVLRFDKDNVRDVNELTLSSLEERAIYRASGPLLMTELWREFLTP